MNCLIKRFAFVIISLLALSCTKNDNVVSVTRFGASPDSDANSSVMAQKAVSFLNANNDSSATLTLQFPKGRYDFYEDSCFVRELYISNHDQHNPKKVAFILENLSNVTIDGQGSEFVFHGRMIPFVLINCRNVTLKNFSIDNNLPVIRQFEVLKVEKDADQLEVSIYPSGNYRIEGSKLFGTNEGFEEQFVSAMPFRKDRRLAFNRCDVDVDFKSIQESSADRFVIKGWSQIPLTSVGERFALRGAPRPTPAVFVDECTDTSLLNVKVHYAEGMGLLAQMSTNITLDGFSVCLKGDDDPRYFTTQADATHFSGCRGVIVSKNGLYEGMADDAINVHGTYLRIIRRTADNQVVASYMHPQSWGFKWGEKGDTVQFVESEKMELVGKPFRTTVSEIKPIGSKTYFGAKEFQITFSDAIPAEISEKGKYGVENLTWTPEVLFSDNRIRNNRARGALFSTPRRVVCENNVFDHTHGTAILLCGDCNGWYETGACTNVVIRGNKFINALTANYQFTNAIISIYPEIPNLKMQKKFFHSGIVVENNLFETFDRPILYAKSVDGLTFAGNIIKSTNEFEPFHWNKYPFFFEHVANVKILHNKFDKGFKADRDLKIDYSAADAVEIN